MPELEAFPLFEDSDRITGICTEAVLGKRFVAPTQAPLSGPGIPATAQVGASDPVDGANVPIGHIPGVRQLGVAIWSGSMWDKVGVATEGIFPITVGPETLAPGELCGAGEKGLAVKVGVAKMTDALLVTGAGKAGLVFRAVEPGEVAGTAWKFIIKVAGAKTAKKVVVAGKVLTVTCATNAGAESITTAKEVMEAVNNDPVASLAFHVALAEGSDGSAVAEAMGEKALEGGGGTSVESGLVVIGATTGNDAYVKLHC
jgi:hypothetical protein